jgi:excisionase family DNA binding protein
MSIFNIKKIDKMNLEKFENRISVLEKMLIGSKEVLNLDEVSSYTGLSKSYLYKLTSTGVIPHFKPIGKLVFFNRKEIDIFLQKNRVSSNDELEKKATHYVTLKKTTSTKDEYDLGAESIVNNIFPPKNKKG